MPRENPIHPTPPRSVRMVALAVACIAVWMVLVAFIRGRWAADLSALYMAGLSVAHGMPDAIYDAPAGIFAEQNAPRWQAMLDALGHPRRLALPYLYPPLWAHLMAPVAAHVPPQAFFDAAASVQMAMLVAMPWLGWEIARPASLPRALWVVGAFGLLLFTVPSFTAIFQNQPQITVSFLVLAGFAAQARGWSRGAGMLLGLAAALKLAPAAFGLIFLLRRDWRALASMAATGAVLLGLSLALGGIEAHRVMLSRLGEIAGMVVHVHINFSAEVVLFEIWRLAQGLPYPGDPLISTPVRDAPAFVQLVPRLLLVATLATMSLRFRTLGTARALLALSLGLSLFGPLSWAHYYVLPLMLLPALFLGVPRRAALIWAGVAAAGFAHVLFSALITRIDAVLWPVVPPVVAASGLLLHLLGARTEFARPGR